MATANDYFMQLAVNEAWKFQFVTYPNPAVGACVVKNNIPIAIEAHKVAGGPHAEIAALKSAYLEAFPNSILKNIYCSHEIHHFLLQNHNNFFKDYEIYVTLEPCNHTGKTPACASLIEQLGLKKVYIGTKDPNKQASGGIQRLKNANIEVQTGILQSKTDDLLLPFSLWQKKSFQFFKLAMREDGSVDGGYITTKDSLTLVHTIRAKLELLVIGGDTVRIDRPTLDCRFAQNNTPPDVLIYSKKMVNEFDQKIPLFEVKNRTVKVADSLNLLQEKNFVMIEGGKKLFSILKDQIDMLMLFVSHKQNINKNNTKKKNTKKKFDIDSLGLKVVHSYFINENDEILFLK